MVHSCNDQPIVCLYCVFRVCGLVIVGSSFVLFVVSIGKALWLVSCGCRFAKVMLSCCRVLL